MSDDPLGLKALTEALAPQLAPGTLFIFKRDETVRRPTTFEVISFEKDERGGYYRAWELEGPRNNRYRGRRRAIAAYLVGRTLPHEEVGSYFDQLRRKRGGGK